MSELRRLELKYVSPGCQCQSDRSQHRNREMALKMLRAKLFEQLYRRRYVVCTRDVSVVGAVRQ